MKIVLKYKPWRDVIYKEDFFNLWELVPQPLQVISTDHIPWVTFKVFYVLHKDKVHIILENEIDEVIFEGNDVNNFNI